MSFIPDTNTISALNVRASSTLAASAVYQGTGENVARFSRAGISVRSDNATDGVLTIEVSHDNITWGGPERTFSDTRFSQPHMWNIVEPYFRIKYTNGLTEATNLSIVVQYSVNADILLGHQLDETLQDETEAIVTRSVLVGETEGHIYGNVGVTGDGKLKVALPQSAFGDLRTVELSPIVQLSFEYTVTNTELTGLTVINSGTVTQSDAMAVVSTGTTTGSTALLESHRHVKYRPGLGGLARFTGLFTSGVADTDAVVGIGDEPGISESFKNGYAVGYNGTVFSFFRWQNDVLIPIAQSAWDDPLDGDGSSGMTLIPTNLNVFFVQFQYLGGGAIKLYVESNVTGDMLLVHTVPYANLYTVPSVYNPNFHLMMCVNNKTTTSDIVAKAASIAFFVEGKTKFSELHQPQQTSGEITKTSVTTETAILTIRSRSTYASKTNFIDTILEAIGVSIESSATNNLGKIKLVRNATLGGTPSWSDINTTDSVIEIDTSGTTVTGGKELITIPLAGKNDREFINVLPYEFILDAGETITIVGSSTGSATIRSSILWKELF